MEKNLKRVGKVAFFVFLVSLMILFSSTVNAASEPYVPQKETLFVTSSEISNNWMLSGVKAEKDVTKLKSSNKKIATVTTFTHNGTVYVGVTAKKPGKTTVSFTARVNGKNKKYSCTVIVKKYTSPFSSLNIGSKDVGKYLTKTYSTDIVINKTLKNQKFSYKLKKGWTINWMSYYNSSNGGNMISLKNGKKITVTSGKQIQINLSNKDGSNLDIMVRFK